MRKRDELISGCMAKARDDEMTFVLLGRDRAAPITIFVWAIVRVIIRKNRWRDPQIQEAFQCARTMRSEHKAAQKTAA